MIRYLAAKVLEIGGKRLEWSVLKWNAKAIKVYEAVGAKVQSEWDTMRVDGEALVCLSRDI